MVDSFSTSSSQATSTPTVIPTPQSNFSLQLSQIMAGLLQAYNDYANSQLAKGSAVTDANIANFMQLAGGASGLAGTLLDQYKNVFTPVMNQFIQQAQTYNSEARQRFEMGRAESTAAQADTAAIDAAKRQLQGYGINPNSGRYQDLMLTARVQDAAARAGAGTAASVNTADRGRQMLQTAAQMGQNVPGMAVNALNSAYQGVNGAEQAILGMLNTGANLNNVLANLGNTAGNVLKQPLMGQTSQSTSQSEAQRSGGGPSSGKASNKLPPEQTQPGASGYDPKFDLGGSKIGSSTAAPALLQNRFAQNQGTGDQSQTGATDYPITPDLAGTLNMGGQFNATPSMFDPATYVGQQTPQFDPAQAADYSNAQPWSVPSQSNVIPQDTQFYNAPTPDINQMFNENMWQPSNTTDPWGGQNFAQPTQTADYNYTPPDFSQIMSDYTGGGGGGGGWDASALDSFAGGSGDIYGGGMDMYTGGAYDTGSYATGSDSGLGSSWDTAGNYGADYGGAGALQDYSGGSTDYAGGGGDYSSYDYSEYAAQGGAIPSSASPSRGKATDDVPARLNAGEYVIPRDVVQWKGQHFFKNLIEQSRKARTGVAGPEPKAKMKPALRMQPTYQSPKV